MECVARRALAKTGMAPTVPAVPVNQFYCTISFAGDPKSYENLHQQNWLAEPGPLFFRKFSVAWDAFKSFQDDEVVKLMLYAEENRYRLS